MRPRLDLFFIHVRRFLVTIFIVIAANDSEMIHGP